MNDSRATQQGRILELLIAARGDWVPLSEIVACTAQHNARIFELRRLGFRVTNRTKEVNGMRHSWFRLESGSQAQENRSITLPENAQAGLFAIPEMERTPRWEDNG